MANLLALESELARKRVTLRGYPYILKIDPSNVCNLRCPQCGIERGAGRRPRGRMSFDTFQRVVDTLGGYCYRILLYGLGEPLLVKDIWRMVRYAADRNIGVAISTNLNRLPDGGAEALVRSGLEQLTVSLDGTTPDVYRDYRVGGDFDTVLDNLRSIIDVKRRLRTRWPAIEWQYLVTRANEHQMEDARIMAGELGVDWIRFSPIGINYQDEAAVDRWVPLQSEVTFYDSDTRELETSKIGRGTCSWLYRAAVINWDGTVSPCCYFSIADEPDYDLGNIMQTDFRTIWNGPLYRSARELAVGRRRPGQGPHLVACDRCDVLGGKTS